MKKLLSILTVAPLALASCVDSVDTSAKGESYEQIIISNFDSAGGTVYQPFDSVPQRVLVEGQASLDIMAALGLSDLVIGSARADALPMKEEWNTDLEDMNHQDELWAKESAALLNPDLIISNTRASFFSTRMGEVTGWHDLGVKTFIMSSQVTYPLSIDKEIDDILTLGRIFNVQDKAQALVDEINGIVADEDTSLPDKELNILFYEDMGDWDSDGNSVDPFWKVYGTNTLAESFTSEINSDFTTLGENMGGKNEEHMGTSYDDADIIITLSNSWQEDKDWNEQDYIDSTINHPVMQSIAAVQNDNVFYMENDYFYAPGVRTGDAILALKETIAKYVDPNA